MKRFFSVTLTVRGAEINIILHVCYRVNVPQKNYGVCTLNYASAFFIALSKCRSSESIANCNTRFLMANCKYKMNKLRSARSQILSPARFLKKALASCRRRSRLTHKRARSVENESAQATRQRVWAPFLCLSARSHKPKRATREPKAQKARARRLINLPGWRCGMINKISVLGRGFLIAL